MNALVILLFALLDTETFLINKNEPDIEIKFQTAKFVPKNHTIGKISEDHPMFDEIGPSFVIDGRVALGTSLHTMPQRFIRSFSVTIGGVEHFVDSDLYSDCFNPNFDQESFSIVLTEDKSTFLIFMDAGGDTTGYHIMWMIKALPDQIEAKRFLSLAYELSPFNFDALPIPIKKKGEH